MAKRDGCILCSCKSLVFMKPKFVFFALFVLFSGSTAFAMLAIRWQASSESNVAGYRIYIGFESGRYEQVLDLGNSNLYLIQDLMVDTTCYFSVTAYNTAGLESRKSEEVSVFLPSSYQLETNPILYASYPNPFRHNAHLICYFPDELDINLVIYNMQGMHVYTILQGLVEPGLYTFQWSGVNQCGQKIAAGVYLASLHYRQRRLSKKIVLVR